MVEVAEVSYYDISGLPLFRTISDRAPWDERVTEWREAVAECSAMVISTPEYLQNMPAQLKSALEWLTTSGELSGKRVLAISYTPHPPRGDKSMKSLLWTLESLEAHVVASMKLYQSEIELDQLAIKGNIETVEMIYAAVQLLLT